MATTTTISDEVTKFRRVWLENDPNVTRLSTFLSINNDVELQYCIDTCTSSPNTHLTRVSVDFATDYSTRVDKTSSSLRSKFIHILYGINQLQDLSIINITDGTAQLMKNVMKKRKTKKLNRLQLSCRTSIAGYKALGEGLAENQGTKNVHIFIERAGTGVPPSSYDEVSSVFSETTLPTNCTLSTLRIMSHRADRLTDVGAASIHRALMNSNITLEILSIGYASIDVKNRWEPIFERMLEENRRSNRIRKLGKVFDVPLPSLRIFNFIVDDVTILYDALRRDPGRIVRKFQTKHGYNVTLPDSPKDYLKKDYRESIVETLVRRGRGRATASSENGSNTTTTTVGTSSDPKELLQDLTLSMGPFLGSNGDVDDEVRDDVLSKYEALGESLRRI